MEISDDFFSTMESLIEDLTPIPDMAALLGWDEHEFRELLQTNEVVSMCFKKKVAEVRRKIRHRDIELAEANSPTAAEAVARHLKNFDSSL